MGRQRKGYAKNRSTMDNYILAEYDGDGRAQSDFFAAVHLNYGKAKEGFNPTTCCYVDAEIHRAIREGDHDRIRELADVVEMVAKGPKNDYLRKIILLIFEELEPDLPTRDELEALVNRRLDAVGIPKVTQRRIRFLMSEMGLKFQGTK